MTPESKKYKRLIALFLLGLILFNYPILSLLNLTTLVLGLPLLYVYTFSVWALLILLTSLITRTRTQDPGQHTADPGL